MFQNITKYGAMERPLSLQLIEIRSDCYPRATKIVYAPLARFESDTPDPRTG